MVQQNESRGRLGILSCRAGEPFGEKILTSLEQRFDQESPGNGRPVKVDVTERHFPNTEPKVELDDSVRGMDLYVVQDCENKESERAMFEEHVPLSQVGLPADLLNGVDPNQLVAVNRPYSVDENLRVMLTALDAAKRADAHYVSAVLPAFPFARQDKAISRECITASRVAEELENHGADRVLTLDIHNTAIAGFFRKIPLENLHSSNVIMAYVREHLSQDNLVVVSPDEGGVARANYFAKRLRSKVAMGYKRRDYSKDSHVDELRILGDVVRRRKTLEDQVESISGLVAGASDPAEIVRKIVEVLEVRAEGLDVLFMDDMVATAGSLVKGVTKVRELGARSVWFACALPLFTYPAVEKIDALYESGQLQGVIGTNAVFHHPERFKEQHPWYHEVHVEKYFADAIYNINHYRSISKLLK